MIDELSIAINRKEVKDSKSYTIKQKAATQFERLLLEKPSVVVRMFIQIVNMSIQISKLKRR